MSESYRGPSAGDSKRDIVQQCRDFEEKEFKPFLLEIEIIIQKLLEEKKQKGVAEIKGKTTFSPEKVAKLQELVHQYELFIEHIGNDKQLDKTRKEKAIMNILESFNSILHTLYPLHEHKVFKELKLDEFYKEINKLMDFEEPEGTYLDAGRVQEGGDSIFGIPIYASKLVTACDSKYKNKFREKMSEGQIEFVQEVAQRLKATGEPIVDNQLKNQKYFANNILDFLTNVPKKSAEFSDRAKEVANLLSIKLKAKQQESGIVYSLASAFQKLFHKEPKTERKSQSPSSDAPRAGKGS